MRPVDKSWSHSWPGRKGNAVRWTWPLTGRSDELRDIGAAIADPDAAGIVIGGTAGVGKSRLVREALSLAVSDRFVVRTVVGSATERNLPLGALAPWTGPGGGSGLELVGTVIEHLTAAPDRSPVIISVDDAHLLDDLSTFALAQIVQRAAAKLVLTVRSGESIPIALQELWRGQGFHRVDLRPLTRDETIALASAALSGPLDPDAARTLWRLTHGNPLYLRNIVEHEIGQHRLVSRRGCWRWAGEPVLPPGLLDLIESRIGALPPAVGEVVDTLAVAEPVDLRSLTRITNEAAAEEAEFRSLITMETVGRQSQVRLAHPLYAEVRRQRGAPARLRHLRGRVVAELAASERCDDVNTVVRQAVLSLESDLPPDAGLLVRAAKGALWLADLALAERLAQAAIDFDGDAEANFIRAHALSWMSCGREADEVLATIPLRQLDELDRSRRACLRAANMLWPLADPDGAKRLVDDALNVTPLHARASIDAFCAMYWAAMGEPPKAMASARNVNVDVVPAVVGAVANWGIVVASGQAGRPDAAVSAADRASAIAVQSFDSAFMRFVIADAQLEALLLAGRVAEARSLAEGLQREAASLPGAAILFSTAIAGRAALGAGDPRQAGALLQPAVELLAAAGERNGFGYRYRLAAVIALAVQGFDEAAVAAVAALEEFRHPSWRCVDYEYEIAQAWVAACRGDVGQAVDRVTSAAETACAGGQFAAEVLCWQTAAQFGDGAGASRLRELTAIVDGPRVALAARFAAGLTTGDGDELTAVSDQFERIGDLVAAVDAAAHAALIYRRREVRGLALKCAIRADALAQQCGVSTSALRRASEPLPLTDRECEIVRLLGQGLSGREIAEQLVLSVRTVDGHIYRAMAKTGTASRDELAALLRQ